MFKKNKPQKVKGPFEFIPEINGRIIVFDTETTGLANADKIWEIGAVEIYNNEISGSFFHAYLDVKKHQSEGAKKVCPLPENFDKIKREEKIVFLNFLRYISDSSIVGHNISFDLRMINNALKRLNIEEPFKNNHYCTKQIFKKIFPSEKATLDNACEVLGIDLTPRKGGHGALIDSKLTAELFIKLQQITMSDKDPKLLYQPLKIETQIEKSKNETSQNISENLNKIEPSLFHEEIKNDLFKIVKEIKGNNLINNERLIDELEFQKQINAIPNKIVSNNSNKDRGEDNRNKFKDVENRKFEVNMLNCPPNILHNIDKSEDARNHFLLLNEEKLALSTKDIKKQNYCKLGSEKNLLKNDLLKDNEKFKLANNQNTKAERYKEINLISGSISHSKSTSPKSPKNSLTNLKKYPPKLDNDFYKLNHEQKDLNSLIGQINNLNIISSKKSPFNINEKLNINSEKIQAMENSTGSHNFINLNNPSLKSNQVNEANNKYQDKISQILENQQLNRIAIASEYKH